MDWVFLVIGIVLLLLGFAGCVLPVIPGPPISFLGFVMLLFTIFYDTGEYFVYIFTGVLATVVTILDYVVPAWGTKKFGGSKKGVWGSIIGLIVGIFVLTPLLSSLLAFLGPFAILGPIIGLTVGPFVGAYIGEKMEGKDEKVALRAAFGSFLGFVAGTVMKLITSAIITGFFIHEIFDKGKGTF